MPGANGRFPRDHRLLKPAEFERIFKGNACRVATGCINLLVLTNGLEHARLGIALTKRHAKRAVARNRIRRQLRESFRLHQPLIAGFDIVVLGRTGIDQISPQELRATADKGWEILLKRCKRS